MGFAPQSKVAKLRIYLTVSRYGSMTESRCGSGRGPTRMHAVRYRPGGSTGIPDCPVATDVRSRCRTIVPAINLRASDKPMRADDDIISFKHNSLCAPRCRSPCHARHVAAIGPGSGSIGERRQECERRDQQHRVAQRSLAKAWFQGIAQQPDEKWSGSPEQRG